MRSLYARLKDVGYTKSFIQKRILPDWWDDSVADSPSGYSEALIAISRGLGFTFESLHTPEAALKLPSAEKYRLKKQASTDGESVRTVVNLACTTAHTMVRSLRNLPEYESTSDPLGIRDEILSTHGIVDLDALLTWSWGRGIVVLPMDTFSGIGKKFTALAMYVESRPVVILASGHDGPPWHVFHLAHELAHISLGHVGPNEPFVVDEEISIQVDLENPQIDPEEGEADRFAVMLLTAQPSLDFSPQRGVDGETLARNARRWRSALQISEGTLALMYGKSAGRMDIAQNALKSLNMATGAHALIRDHLSRYLPDERSETLDRSLGLLGYSQDDLDALDESMLANQTF